MILLVTIDYEDYEPPNVLIVDVDKVADPQIREALLKSAAMPHGPEDYNGVRLVVEGQVFAATSKIGSAAVTSYPVTVDGEAFIIVRS